MEAWKRKCAKLSHRWDVFDYEREEETIRPQYARLCTECRPNVVTQKVEPYFPRSIQRTRILIGVITSLLLLSLVIVFMIAVIIYRCLVTIPLFRHPALRSQASIFANMTGACINLVLIMILGRLYQTLAYKMTQWEMHETQSAFDKYLTIKVFLFEFVNYYASIFYIAFFKGRLADPPFIHRYLILHPSHPNRLYVGHPSSRFTDSSPCLLAKKLSCQVSRGLISSAKFVGHPGAFATFLGLRNEACSTGGCLVELAQDLLVFMVGKQIVNNCQEILFPIVASWFHRKKSGLVMAKSSDAESGNLVQKQYMDDYRLFKNAGLFEEYIEMVIQFGFITLFVAAFPLAPLFALCNNWLEIRIDAQKLVCATRRPLAQRARSIGIWFSLTEVIVGISIITNGLLIAFTSEFLQKILYAYDVNPDLTGYTNFTLVAAPQNMTRLPCMYQDFRTAEGDYTEFYWKLLVVRLTFVILFEHAAFFIARLLDLLIPDIPKSLDIQLRRERFVAKQALACVRPLLFSYLFLIIIRTL
ncbi:unnamed protein product [Schistocephalus solidus]|uniref:Anoctamin n=1 Tax=Schistocephalus solidus TaxID=70667 RepID=A0A3P7EV85_SCHSO|nr:unnamed protein product [Schistocephalus solidus]